MSKDEYNDLIHGIQGTHLGSKSKSKSQSGLGSRVYANLDSMVNDPQNIAFTVKAYSSSKPNVNPTPSLQHHTNSIKTAPKPLPKPQDVKISSDRGVQSTNKSQHTMTYNEYHAKHGRQTDEHQHHHQHHQHHQHHYHPHTSMQQQHYPRVKEDSNSNINRSSSQMSTSRPLPQPKPKPKPANLTKQYHSDNKVTDKYPDINELDKRYERDLPTQKVIISSDHISSRPPATFSSAKNQEITELKPKLISPPHGKLSKSVLIRPPITSMNDKEIRQPQILSHRGSLSGVKCAGCGNSISGRVVNAMGKRWHPEHFSCVHCGENLEHVAFYQQHDRPYCHLDYHELFSPKCSYCNTPIEENVISALGKHYHQLHFFCRDCGDPFAGAGSNSSIKPFIVEEGYPYCEKCHTRRFAPKCFGCKKPILGGNDYVNAFEKTWHSECFVCSTCKNEFDNMQFYVDQGKPFCPICFKVVLLNRE